jgi:hypothetical protein
VTGRPSAPSGPLLDDQTAAALTAVVLLQIATLQHFEIEGERHEVVAACTRYLDLLCQHITDLGLLASRERPEKKR